jgi:hypothetical protein
MVSRLTLTLAIGSLFCCLGGCGRPDRRTRTAMALLSENEALSLRVAKERVASARPAGGARPTPAKEVTEGDGADTQSASHAARIAVCRETLAIVEELLEELGHRSKGELDNLLVEAATLQQSRCGASGYPHTPNRKGRDQGSTRERELHQVMRRLDTLLPLAEAELQELTRPYVPRLLAVVADRPVGSNGRWKGRAPGRTDVESQSGGSCRAQTAARGGVPSSAGGLASGLSA